MNKYINKILPAHKELLNTIITNILKTIHKI